MANSEWKNTEGPTRLICAECGSDDVYGSASVVWDDTDQLWEIEGHIEAMHCRACDRSNVEVNAVQITMAPPVFRTIRKQEGAL